MNKRYIDRRAFLALLRAVKERRRLTARRDYFLIYFLARTGLRCSEALALRVMDLHLDTDPPYVQVATLKQRRKQTDQLTLDERTVRAANRYIRRVLPRLLRRMLTAERVAPGPACPLFVSGQADVGEYRPMSDRNARRIFDVYRRRAHLAQGVTLHSLRHYHGTSVLRATGDLEYARQRLRHRFISSTQRYLHVDPETERRYLSKLGKR